MEQTNDSFDAKALDAAMKITETYRPDYPTRDEEILAHAKLVRQVFLVLKGTEPSTPG